MMHLHVQANHPTLDAARIAGPLWIGSKPPLGTKVAAAGFKTLVLCASDYQPAAESFPGVEVVHAPFHDFEGAVDRDMLTLVDRASSKAARRIRSNKQTLVTCAAGRNRSGLVSALALSKAAGMDPAVAGELVRKARGSAALTNGSFVDLLNGLRGEDCELCSAEPILPRFYEDHLCWASLCKTCAVPMVVLRRHTVTPTPQEVSFMTGMLEAIAAKQSDGVRYALDLKRRSIPGHWHAHARPVEARRRRAKRKSPASSSR